MKAGTVTITLKPTASARRAIATGKRVSFTILVGYTPNGGSLATWTLRGSIKVQKKRHHR